MLTARRRLLFPLLHGRKGRLRNAISDCVHVYCCLCRIQDPRFDWALNSIVAIVRSNSDFIPKCGREVYAQAMAVLRKYGTERKSSTTIFIYLHLNIKVRTCKKRSWKTVLQARTAQTMPHDKMYKLSLLITIN